MPAEAPVAPAPAVIPAAAKAPALPSAPKVEISASKIGEGAGTPEPPKPGSARERMNAELRKRAGQEPGTERPLEKVKDKSNEEPEGVKPAPKMEEAEETKQTEEVVKDADGKPVAADPKKPKVSPWKLLEEYKQKAADLEAKILETEKRAIPEAKWKETQETLTAREKRLAELEEEMRYVNYSKTEEFKKQYQEPYDKSWERAMSELGELTVETADGGVRALEPNDILELVNLPLGKAHELAGEKFGDLAGEVMAHRKEIRKLFDAQATALQEARKNGAERETQTLEQRKKQYGEVTTAIREVYSKANDEIKADPKYGKFFTPIEGDENVNQRLAKGFELADRAFSENPMNAKTAEERAAIVKRHAAVRNRAAAFGRLVYENTNLTAKIAELQKVIDDYKGSTPELKGSSEQPAATAKISAMERSLQELRKRAKQL